MADAAPQPASSPQPARPSNCPLSRILLLSILGLAVISLGIDYVGGRIPQGRDCNLLSSKLMPPDSDENGANPGGRTIGPNVEFVTVEDVHGLLKREPAPADCSETPDKNSGDSKLVEIYRYPGVFNTYLLRVTYLKRLHVSKGAPATSMQSVAKATKGPFGSGDFQEEEAPLKMPIPVGKSAGPAAAKGADPHGSPPHTPTPPETTNHGR